MSAHKPLHLFEAKAADTRISKDEPAVARLNFSLANGEVLVVEVPRYVLERLLVRAKRAIEAAPLLARGRSVGHSVIPGINNSMLSSPSRLSRWRCLSCSAALLLKLLNM
jgi:hypothetical protein